MPIKDDEKNEIVKLICETIRYKLKTYKPESNNMPFHYRLLGKDRMALFSFIQSLNTTFGTSIFEPIAEYIAKKHFKKAIKQYNLGNRIDTQAQLTVQNIINQLSTGNIQPDKAKEIEVIRSSIHKSNPVSTTKTVKVDLYLVTHDDVHYFIDLKTAKPNISNFKDFKRTLLEWIAIALTENTQLNVCSLIAIPYNPYEPKPYERWTIKGMLDDHELLVGKEFWDFLGGDHTYETLLESFEKAGIILRPEIDEHFKNLDFKER